MHAARMTGISSLRVTKLLPNNTISVALAVKRRSAVCTLRSQDQDDTVSFRTLSAQLNKTDTIMTEHGLRWSAQARLMRHDILETPVSRAGVSSLVGGC